MHKTAIFFYLFSFNFFCLFMQIPVEASPPTLKQLCIEALRTSPRYKKPSTDEFPQLGSPNTSRPMELPTQSQAESPPTNSTLNSALRGQEAEESLIQIYYDTFRIPRMILPPELQSLTRAEPIQLYTRSAENLWKRYMRQPLITLKNTPGLDQLLQVMGRWIYMSLHAPSAGNPTTNNQFPQSNNLSDEEDDDDDDIVD